MTEMKRQDVLALNDQARAGRLRGDLTEWRWKLIAVERQRAALLAEIEYIDALLATIGGGP